MSLSENRAYIPSEAAHRLHVTTARTRRRTADGRLPHRRTPLSRLFGADAVDALAFARSTARYPEQGVTL